MAPETDRIAPAAHPGGMTDDASGCEASPFRNPIA